ncbi:regulatory-associated protein of TOR 1-like [Andrographis paniculata]|uniref:regulatory-associated protein of TOR 1-like n=1 Tax=Andrographis paniculata TaxID=175694 RepID=UPI0021E75022|nr:regulatory-associated protein of TOR 1-like [Andrographis paniculata]
MVVDLGPLLCLSLSGATKNLLEENNQAFGKISANLTTLKSYTQYIPLQIIDLNSWLKTPSIYVFDCSAAGFIVNAFIELKENSTSSSGSSMRNCILLQPVKLMRRYHKVLSFLLMCLLPALQHIKMALRCFRSLHHESIDYSLIDRIPGRQTDKKTLLGELNWIFTAVTDTIAWNVLPHDLFQRLFRQDLLVASLFGIFLLAERIMRSEFITLIFYVTYVLGIWIH